MKELIEKINKTWSECNLIGMSLTGYNIAMAEVKSIIQSHYKELDKQDMVQVMYKELIAKVTLWWNEIYPEDIFTGVSGDEGALRVKEIRDLLNKVKEQEKPLDKPDSEGWWWFEGEILGEKTECYIQVQGKYWGTAYMRPSTESIHCGRIDDIKFVKGKWVKAICHSMKQ